MRAMLLLLLLSPVVMAQERMPPSEPALPPPQINDEGVKTVPEPAQAPGVHFIVLLTKSYLVAPELNR